MNRISAAVLVPAVLVLAASTSNALDARPPGPEWELANKRDDLIIYTRDNPKVGTRDLVAVGEVDGTPESVFRIVTDFDRYPKFMPYVKESKTLKRADDNRLTVYSLLSPPLVDDRDYAIDVTMTPGSAQNGGKYTSAWVSVPEAAPERGGVIRVKINTGSWQMEPIDGGKRSRVTYTVSTHPGGSIPTWIANKSNTVAIPDLFKAVREQAAKARR